MNLLIIGYCHLADGFLYASQALEKFNFTIFFFKYQSYIMDNKENIDNLLLKFIEENDINICLWWNNSISFEFIENIIINTSHLDIKNIFYNWDPFLYSYKEYNLYNWKERIENKKKIYPLMNYVFSCFEKEIEIFKNELNIYYNPPGFDLNISKFIEDEKYKCDISIVCTNIYNDLEEFPDNATNIPRYEVVNKLYSHRNEINFHIYGTENLKNLYPDCYKGLIKYDDCYKVFSNSKINLSIHPIIYELSSKDSKEEYFSERLPQILGCKGLLVSNSYFSKYLENKKDYILIENQNYFETILDIINNSEKYNEIRENGYKKACLFYQWNNWADTILKTINQKEID